MGAWYFGSLEPGMEPGKILWQPADYYRVIGCPAVFITKIRTASIQTDLYCYNT